MTITLPLVVWSTNDWAEAIVALAGQGPLPCRTVLVPRERVAHSLRRELVRLKRVDALAGTQFTSLSNAAAGVLDAAGVEFSQGEARLRSLRLREIFGTALTLRYFDPAQLRDAPGWDEAF